MQEARNLPVNLARNLTFKINKSFTDRIVPEKNIFCIMLKQHDVLYCHIHVNAVSIELIQLRIHMYNSFS